MRNSSVNKSQGNPVSSIVLLAVIFLLTGINSNLISQINYSYGVNYNVPLMGNHKSQTSHLQIRNSLGINFGIQKNIFSKIQLGTGIEMNFLKNNYTLNPVLKNDRIYGSTSSKNLLNYFTIPISAEIDVYKGKKVGKISFYSQLNMSFFPFKITSLDSFTSFDPNSYETYHVHSTSRYYSGFFPGAKLGIRYIKNHFSLSVLANLFFKPIYSVDYSYASASLSEQYKYKFKGTYLVLNIAYTISKFKSQKESLDHK